MNIYIQTICNFSQKNKYFYWWKSIIERGVQRSKTRNEAKLLLGYVEGHHIIPVSFNLGGNTDLNNIVFLTSKEHIMVHRLMCKFLSGEYKTKSLRAFHCMCFKDNGGQNKRAASLHQLAKAREANSIANKGVTKGPKGVPSWFTESNDFDIFCDRLRELVDEGLSDPQIGEKYDVSATAIFNWRNKLNLKRRRRQLRDKKWLHDHYVNKKLSAQQVADIVGCTGTAILQYLIRYNIPIRTPSERQQNVDKNKRGFFPAKDVTGKKYFIKKDDPRYLSGELVGWAKRLPDS
jgi:hypothetical protein